MRCNECNYNTIPSLAMFSPLTICLMKTNTRNTIRWRHKLFLNPNVYIYTLYVWPRMRKWVQMSKIHIFVVLLCFINTNKTRVQISCRYSNWFLRYMHSKLNYQMKFYWFCAYFSTASLRRHCQNNDLPHLGPFSHSRSQTRIKSTLFFKIC